MSKNKTLSAAKSAKNDEFYTQYNDIQKEVNAYLEYDPDTFRGQDGAAAVRRSRMEQVHALLCRELRAAGTEEAHLDKLCRRVEEDWGTGSGDRGTGSGERDEGCEMGDEG